MSPLRRFCATGAAFAALALAAVPSPAQEPAPAPDSPHVVRGRASLTLAGASAALDAALAKAAEMKLKVNVWVVDDGGHPLAFARMDGARPASAYTALTKARTAATFRQATGPLVPPGSDLVSSTWLNLSLQNAAEAGGWSLTTLHGGVPIEVDGQVVGALGVGGGSGEQDAEVARAGAAAVRTGDAGE